MLRLIITIIISIDFYSAYFKKNIGVKEKNKNKIITIKPNNWKKTLTPGPMVTRVVSTSIHGSYI